MDVLRLLGARVPVFAPEGAELDGLAYTPVSAGDEFSAAGFRVRATGHGYRWPAPRETA